VKYSTVPKHQRNEVRNEFPSFVFKLQSSPLSGRVEGSIRYDTSMPHSCDICSKLASAAAFTSSLASPLDNSSRRFFQNDHRSAPV
jgi:hypothetical protein